MILDPLLLSVDKKYNLNNVKEIKVTEDFLGLDKNVIGCQNEMSFNDCKTGELHKVLKSKCGCLPFSIIESDQVVLFYTYLTLSLSI